MPKALSIMEAIRGLTSTWPQRAKTLGIRRPEIEWRQRAFQRS
jgi:hypothetical protein